MDRLLRCTFRFDGWVAPLSWLSMLGWDDVCDARWRGVIPQRITRVAFRGPLPREMLRHAVRLCRHTLRGLEDSAIALDVYLWDVWLRVDPEPAPRLVEACHALAEHPVPSPDGCAKRGGMEGNCLGPSPSDAAPVVPGGARHLQSDQELPKMMWTLPRSHPGASTTHERPSACLTASRDRGLPYGTVARVLLAWMYAETTRTGDDASRFGASYRALVEALEFDALEFEEQLMRLADCCLETRAGRGRMLTWVTLSWPEGATDRRFPDEEAIILPSHPLAADIRRHPLTLCTQTLRALRDRPLALDLYLWKRYHASQRRTFNSLRLYHELAEAPSAMPTQRELEAFERQASAALKGVAAPSELFSHPLPESGQARAQRRVESGR